MIGGLLGDVFLHLLPHAFLGEHVESGAMVQVNEQKNVLIGMGIFGGLFFFFVMDKLMRVFNGGSGHDHHHHHQHQHQENDHDHATTSAVKDSKDNNNLRQRNGGKKNEDEKEEEHKHSNNNNNNDGGIKLSAYLNLLADFTHNMTDGLAMAASFYASPSVGATTAVAVFFHEIPHEVGDYAILIQSGFTKQRAMMAQFTTAVGAFLGTIIGIVIEQMSRSSSPEKAAHDALHDGGIMATGLQWSDLVIPFTAGGFMYIATVGVIPELLEMTGKIQKDRRQALYEFGAMLVGLALMAVIAWNEGAA